MPGLVERLQREIEQSGPISIADYMNRCLGDPELGYYTTRDPIGARGDFITAPEISQMFGELIGLWCVSVWTEMGSPTAFNLVELGPGRGTLMADLIRASAVRSGFLDACSVHLVEMSPKLRATQKATLTGAAPAVTWHDRLSDVPDGPVILVANEFFDALPIRQFVFDEKGWRERQIGLDETGDLAFRLGPLLPAEPVLDARLPRPRAGDCLEASPVSDAHMREICHRLAGFPSAALIIDYGIDRPGFGDTFQAVARHGYANPLANPGMVDLTAHVNFPRLASIAADNTHGVHGPIGQGRFLLAMGLLERAGALGASASEDVRAEITAAVNRLAGDDQMGQLFKVLAVTSHNIAAPGFDR